MRKLYPATGGETVSGFIHSVYAATATKRLVLVSNVFSWWGRHGRRWVVVDS